MAFLFDLEHFLRNSKGIDLDYVDWAEVPKHPLSEAEIRVLKYFMSIEAHTIHYLKELLSTKSGEDEDTIGFLSCWNYEEFHHGYLIKKFLQTYGVSLDDHAPTKPRDWYYPLFMAGQWAFTKLGGDKFIAIHMLVGAINELATSEGYMGIVRQTQHPELAKMLKRINQDERRHFAFYFSQAQERLKDPATRRLCSTFMPRFFAPVGTGLRPQEDVDFTVAYVMNGEEGMRTAERIDATFMKLPGYENGFRAATRVLEEARQRLGTRAPAPPPAVVPAA